MFDANQKNRQDELDAINEAIKIISSPKVSKFNQVDAKKMPQVTSLLQTQSSTRRIAVKQRVSTLLERRAELLSSSTLKSFADEVAGSPFTKVIGLVKGLIAKLKEEAAA